MKGHSDIILTDTRTGHVEHYSDDNMVTNALNYMFASCCPLNYLNFSGMSNGDNTIASYLGGLLLFDKAQTEDKDNIFTAAGTRMVGNGVNGYASNDDDGVTEMGTFNSTESGWDDNRKVYTQVWDFSTAQANGTIACACLTSAGHGFEGEGNFTSHKRKPAINNGSWFAEGDSHWGEFNINKQTLIPVKIDGNFFYGFLINSDGNYNINKLSTIRQYIPHDSIKLNYTNLTACEVIKEQDFGSEDAWLWGDYACPTYSHIGNKVYIVWNVCSRTDIPVTEIDMDTMEFTTHSLPYKFGINDGGIRNFSQAQIDETHTYLAYSSGKCSIYDWTADSIKDITVNDSSPSLLSPTRVINKRLYLDKDIYDLELNELVPINQQNRVMQNLIGVCYNNPLFTLECPKKGSDQKTTGAIAHRYGGYLATINNLSTPVTKDNTRTMKVIYTLTFDD